ncbi:MAG: DegT/DnrJ/EryC1/StrS family aminotransferase [Bacteroidia bacterium]|nr:DegT/DnrJ/EryC1/StrS family aminotransferase [Bacteroidia bacterium]
MNEIKMVDLQGQYLKIKTEIDSAISDVIEASSFINGAEVINFKNELARYLDVRHVIPCANGTDALQVAMMALELKPGDEIITSDFTFIATVEVIKLLGLTPVLVDVDPGTFNMDTVKLEKAVTGKTKAIVPVHLFGQCADMDEIQRIAKKYNLYVIEDNAQSLGAKYTFADGSAEFAGKIGTIGCTSFFPAKNLGCFGDGGALYTNNDQLGSRLQIIVNHGSKTKYYHDDIGVNSRLDTIQAAILRVKLKYLDEYCKARNTVADYYDRMFGDCPKIKIPYRNKKSTHVFHQYTIVLKGINRDEMKSFLKTKGIPAMVYYPVPMHLQKAYSDQRYKPGDFLVTEELCRSVLSLPMHTELDDEQLKYISENVMNYVSNS